MFFFETEEAEEGWAGVGWAGLGRCGLEGCGAGASWGVGGSVGNGLAEHVVSLSQAEEAEEVGRLLAGGLRTAAWRGRGGEES